MMVISCLHYTTVNYNHRKLVEHNHSLQTLAVKTLWDAASHTVEASSNICLTDGFVMGMFLIINKMRYIVNVSRNSEI